MVITLGVSAMIWCILSFHPVHATIQCTYSNETTSPITNLTVNLKGLELTWDSSLNITKYQCTMKTKNSFVEKEEDKKNCIFSGRPIHEGAIFRVEGNYDTVSYSSECTFIPEGLSGTSVENFTCMIYNVSFMNCTWTPGRNASEDTQYFLYQFSNKDEMECQHYIKDAHGRHTACRFQDVMIEDTNPVYFLVNGSSKKSKIQFYDEYIKLHEIEFLTAPTNITVNCTEEPPLCIVEWEPPRTSKKNRNHCFRYNIDIQSKPAMADPAERSDDPLIIVNENTYRFEHFNVKKKHFLKIRARGYNCHISENWGEWSETTEFGNDEESMSLTIIVLIFILGTVTVALLVLLFSKRYCNMRIFFPPIPQPKNKFSEPAATDSKIQREFETPPIKYETEEVITTVEEMSPFPKAN